jgi:hypothetical protein
MARISREDYEAGVRQAFQLAALLMELDLEPLIDAINYADTIGPIIDPTLWMRGNRAMEQHGVILHALRMAQAKIAPARAELARIMGDQLAKRAEEAESAS